MIASVICLDNSAHSSSNIENYIQILITSTTSRNDSYEAVYYYTTILKFTFFSSV